MRGILILAAGGSGKRFSEDQPKQLVRIKEIPVFLHTLRKFYIFPWLRRALIGTSPSLKREMENLLKNERAPFKVEVIDGGIFRSGTVKNCLENIFKKDEEFDLVLIHDSVRPVIFKEDIEKLAREAIEWGVAIPGTPVRDTLKEVEGESVIKTSVRKNIWAVFTPQCFRKDVALKLLPLWSDDEGIPDDAFVAERAGIPVKVVRVNPLNLKLTFPEDLKAVEKLL